MADVTGPISTLPGATRSPPKGTTCDAHPDRPATARVQGETDSFGSEMHDMCDECFTKHREYQRSPQAIEDSKGTCDWCKTPNIPLAPTRDYDEGSCGRVYDVCQPCRKKQNDEAARELEEMRASGDFDYDDPEEDDYLEDEPEEE